MPNRVVSQFDDFYRLEKKLQTNWERFLFEGELPKDQRNVIVTSWNRCMRNQLDPLNKNGKIVSSLKEKQEQNKYLLDIFLPQMEEIFQIFKDEEISIVLADKDGIILEKIANLNTKRKLENSTFHPGADWSEKAAGTNAIGTALIEKAPVQIFSSEHFRQVSHPWVCSAAPIFDPVTEQILGVLNLTGGKKLVKAHDMGLVINMVKKIQEGIGSCLLSSNVFQMYSLLESIKDPVVIFDSNGKILRFNEAARYLLRVNYGNHLPKFTESPMSPIDIKTIQSKYFQNSFKTDAGDEWSISIQPYQLGEHLLGGMATFQKIGSGKSTRISPKGHKTRYDFSQILTNSPLMKQLIKLAKKAAFSESTVFISGESGTGKEVLAQSIHNYGPRQKKPFVGVNCGAIPRELLASELFGYEGGSFTGAKSQGKKGKFYMADGGTIFLDEIGDLPLEAQVYLLRVLEERTIVPIGGAEPLPIDVRVITATHKDLKQEVKQGRFREDLFHRLNVISLFVPPLRDRSEDIHIIVQHFLKEISRGFSIPELEEEVWNYLQEYSWPGNIRQLKNVIEQCIFHSEDGVVRMKNLPRDLQNAMKRLPFEETAANNPIKWKVPMKRKLDQETLIDALHETGGNVSEVARLFNVSRMTIYRKMKQFGME